MSEALKRDAEAAGATAGKGKPKGPRNQVNSDTHDGFVRLCEESWKLSCQTARRQRIAEAAVFEYITVDESWWVIKAMDKVHQDYEKALKEAGSGAARRKLHRVPKHLCAWVEIVTGLCANSGGAAAANLTDYAAEIGADVLAARNEVKCLMKLDVFEKERIRLQVHITPNTRAAEVWETLRKEAMGYQRGEVLCGVAPRSKSEKKVLKGMFERGVIDDPHLGNFDGA